MPGNRLTALLLIFIFLLYSDYALCSSFGEKSAAYLKDKGINKNIVLLVISTLPIVELRGAVPVGINLLKMQPFHVYIICVLGNMIPVIPILLLFGPVTKLLNRWKLTKKILNFIILRTKSKTEEKIKKYEALGLTLFVAIPLPVTGAWTGCLAAFIFQIGFTRAFTAIMAGVCIAGIIMTTVSILGWIGFWIAVTALSLLLIRTILKIIGLIRT